MSLSESRRSFEPNSSPSLARLCRTIGPNQISLVTTVSSQGVPNMAPYSFVTPCSYDPPMVAFACARQKHLRERGFDATQIDETEDTLKDTMVNIRATGEYVISPLNARLRSVLMVAEKPWRHGVNEMEKVGLTECDPTHTRVPLIAEADIALECILDKIVPTGDMDLIVGEVIVVHASAETVVDGVPDPSTIAPTYEGIHENQYFALGVPVALRRDRPYDYSEFSPHVPPTG